MRVTEPKWPFSTEHKSKPMDRNYNNEGQPGRQGFMAEAFGGDQLKAQLAAKEMQKTGGMNQLTKPPVG